MATAVIVNNTVLSNFAAVGRLDVLRRAVLGVLITRQVYDEVLSAIEHGHQFQELTAREITDRKWIRLAQLQINELADYAALRRSLGLGEASSLIVARRKGVPFLTDDLKARKLCDAEGVAFSGTLGVLQEAVRRHVLELAEADNILTQMIANGYFSPVHSLGEL